MKTLHLSGKKQNITGTYPDKKQIEELYHQYYKHIYSMVQKKFPRDTAHDLATDIFLKIIFNLDKYKNQGKGMQPWISTVTRNEIIQTFRSQKKSVLNNSADISDLFYKLSEHEADKEDDALMEIWPAVKKILLDMDEDSLKLIVLRFFRRWPYAKIAQELNIRENNAKVRMKRLLERIRKELQKTRFVEFTCKTGPYPLHTVLYR